VLLLIPAKKTRPAPPGVAEDLSQLWFRGVCHPSDRDRAPFESRYDPKNADAHVLFRIPEATSFSIATPPATPAAARGRWICCPRDAPAGAALLKQDTGGRRARKLVVENSKRFTVAVIVTRFRKPCHGQVVRQATASREEVWDSTRASARPVWIVFLFFFFIERLL